ncbi:hypothetical protein J7E90_12365 [Streptomyces sp. ISL-111]|nr:hypothetical protein [Streptomyces sp. ISL-111]MBT2424978.1 hypothetical protein [Streptomyces sp. ISL-112]MBT2460369.1 hypothetical protein [Streptomyces sp. ISL-63]
MAPGRPAVWSSRCAVCLLVAVGAVLGPLGPPGGTASADGPSVSAAPSGASSPAATPLPSGFPAGLPSGASPSSALRSGLFPPSSGIPGTGGAAEPVEPFASLSADGGDVEGAKAPEGSVPPSPSRSASVEVSGSTAPMAGREAGAGKARPGRSLTPLELARAETPAAPEPSDEPEGSTSELPVLTPPPEAFSEPGPPAARALDAAAVRQVQQVFLGTGIALVGLGIAFLALRLRRVN